MHQWPNYFYSHHLFPVYIIYYIINSGFAGEQKIGLRLSLYGKPHTSHFLQLCRQMFLLNKGSVNLTQRAPSLLPISRENWNKLTNQTTIIRKCTASTCRNLIVFVCNFFFSIRSSLGCDIKWLLTFSLSPQA